MDGDSEYRPNDSVLPEERAYGAVSEDSLKNISPQDEAEDNVPTGSISKQEVDEVRAAVGEDEFVSKGTRSQGKSNDAYKQERELDQTLSEKGVI